MGCSVRGRFYDLAWSKPVFRAPAVHGVSSLAFFPLNNLGLVEAHSKVTRRAAPARALQYPKTVQAKTTSVAPKAVSTIW